MSAPEERWIPMCGRCLAMTSGYVRDLPADQAAPSCSWRDCTRPAVRLVRVPEAPPAPPVHQHWHAYECPCGTLWEVRRDMHAPVAGRCPDCGRTTVCSDSWTATESGHGGRADLEILVAWLREERDAVAAALVDVLKAGAPPPDPLDPLVIAIVGGRVPSLTPTRLLRRYADNPGDGSGD